MKSESGLLLMCLLCVTVPLGPLAFAAKWHRAHEEAKMDRRIAEMQKELDQYFANSNSYEFLSRIEVNKAERDSYLSYDYQGLRRSIYDLTAKRNFRPNVGFDFYHLKQWSEYWFGVLE
jgi:hypothetical protein